MKSLYPLKFEPITHYRIWGGNKLNEFVADELKKDRLGEIWSISGVEGNVSVVSAGPLKGYSLNELIEIYKDRLLGFDVWHRFGMDFPLLIKFIDSQEPLSVQVHPDDEQAELMHNSFGKSEMWYITEAEPEGDLIVGFKEGVTKEDYKKHLEAETLEEILQKVPVEKGDAVYIPAGRVHAIGAGVTLAEIQQTSDITYRIYDYNRIDKDGEKRELHTAQALEVMDFNPVSQVKTPYRKVQEEFTPLVNSPFFKTNIFTGNKIIYASGNTEMAIFICTDGKAAFIINGAITILEKYESLLMPAFIDKFEIHPKGMTTLIAVTV